MSDAANFSRCEFPFDAFLVLAGKLQETAEAMLAFCRSASAEKDSSKTDDDAELAEHGCKPGEYRQYHLPPYALTEEGELLDRYKAENIAAALDAIYNDLFATVFLMKGYDADSKITNFTLYQIGELLSRSLGMLSKTGSVLADYNLMHVKRIPTA